MCEKEMERIISEHAARGEELTQIAEAIGTNEGHSSVEHIVALKKENERLKRENFLLSKVLILSRSLVDFISTTGEYQLFPKNIMKLKEIDEAIKQALGV